jgi:phosphopantothenoylcysteine decarboxylase/phosphopantothenate--cysteine ligase
MNKNILIGITGGIAAYKICSLINFLKKERVEVKVILTEAAQKFITPLTFQTLSGNTVYTDMFKIIDTTQVEHIALAKWCNLMLVAPATANTIGKIANGIADNLLTTVVMALPKETPVLIAPAMNTNMWRNKFVQQNIKKLKEIDRYHLIGPRSGKLACGDEGEGALVDKKEITAKIKALIE